MFKKAIAGAMSAVLCASALLSGGIPDSRLTAVSPESADTAAQEPSGEGLAGSNSLTRYLAQQPVDNRAAAQPLKASAADVFFAVTGLDFDAETGLIRAVSSQSEDCRLLVMFADEDAPANVYKVEFSVSAGEYVTTEGSADLSRLPEFYTVTAQLVNRIGTPQGDAFRLTSHTREMREILDKTVSDFAPEQVVNFDEDERTNFIVLSEDTVQPETDDNTNTLISADYDQNVYVFGNIDESFRSLNEGQYLYIQPTEDDIIAVNVQDVTIDGDTATVSGGGEIDDMFDFIKLDIEADRTIETEEPITEADLAADSAAYQEAPAETEAESENGYLGVNAQVIDSQDELKQRIRELEAIDPDAELTTFKKKLTVKPEKPIFKKQKVSVTPAFTIDATVKWNVYKYFDYINIFFVCEAKTTLTLTATYKTSTPATTGSSGSSSGDGTSSGDGSSSGDSSDGADEEEELPDGAAGLPESGTGDNDQPDRTPKHLIKIPIATVGAGDIYAFIDIGLSLTVDGQISVEKKFTKGFVFDSYKGFEAIDFDTSPAVAQASLKGSFTLDIKVGFEVSALKGLITGSVAGGFKATATCQFATASTGSYDNQTFNQSGTGVFKPDPPMTANHIHADEKCYKIEITFKVYIEAKVTAGFNFEDDNKIFKALNKLRFEKTWTYETDEVLGHKLPKVVVFISNNSTSGTYKGWDINIIKADANATVECPHQAYKVDFVIDFQNAPSGTQAELIIDGQRFPLTVASPSRLVLYAVPNNSPYVFYVDVDGERKINDTFRIKDYSVVVKRTIYWTVEGTEPPKVHVGDGSVEDGETYTSPVYTTPTIDEEEFDYSDYEPPKEMISKFETLYDLGEHISGTYSNDGTFSVYGYGDMYADASIPASVRSQIRQIVFYDQNPEKNLFINNIANSLFSGAKDLEVVYMPQRITAIGAAAFSGCESLKWLRYGGYTDKSTTFTLPSVLTSIGDNAFNGCKSAVFGDLKIPKGVSSIGYMAFGSCEGIASLDVPGDSEPTIGEKAFTGCCNLKKAVMNKGVQKVGAYVFEGCGALEDLTLPFFDIEPAEEKGRLVNLFNAHGAPDGFYCVYTHWRSISYHVDLFAPSSLKHVTILTGSTVPANFFNNFKYLESVTICGEVTEIGERAFSDCAKLKDLYFGAKNIDSKKTALPQDLTAVNPYTFSGCESLQFGDLTIPASVDSVGTTAFSGCKGITALYVPGKTDADKAPVVTIGDYAFSRCTGIKKIELDDGVKSVGEDAFEYCISLSELMIPRFDLKGAICDWFNDSAGDYADSCYLGYSYPRMMGGNDTACIPNALKKIVVTGGTVIPRDYFRYLKMVETIECLGDITEIEQDAFSGCEALEMIRFGKESSPAYIMLPDSLTTVGNSVFSGCKSAKFGALVIPETLVSVGQNAFSGCEGITSLIVPGNGETALGSGAFYGCKNMKKAVLWDGVKSIGGNLFASCVSLEELVIESYDQFGTTYNYFNSSNDNPDDLYLAYSFTNMFGHTDSAFVPNSLKSIAIARSGNIPGYKFEGMKSIENVTLPVVPETVDSYAFRNCAALKNVNLIGESGDWTDVTIRNDNDALLSILGEDRTGGSYAPLVILAQPADAVVYTGTKTTYYCMAAGKYELHYLWQYTDDEGKTWLDAGSTEYKLTVTADKAVDGRMYRCVVEDVKGNRVISDEVTLTVRNEDSSKPAGYHPGDLNGDGSVDVSDAVLLARFVAEDRTAVISSIGILNADVDGSGNAGMEDITLILQYIAKIIRAFPVDEG